MFERQGVTDVQIVCRGVQMGGETSSLKIMNYEFWIMTMMQINLIILNASPSALSLEREP